MQNTEPTYSYMVIYRAKLLLSHSLGVPKQAWVLLICEAIVSIRGPRLQFQTNRSAYIMTSGKHHRVLSIASPIFSSLRLYIISDIFLSVFIAAGRVPCSSRL